jgi:hypothetical protein
LPENFKVNWIASPDDVKDLKRLIGKPYVGVDCEWKSEESIYGSQKRNGPAII